MVDNTTSFAKIYDPAGTRNFRKTGPGTLNLNFSGNNNPGDFIRHEGSSSGPFNMYGSGTAGRIVYYGGNNSLIAPGDLYDVSSGAVSTGTGALDLLGEIILHPAVTLAIDLAGEADYDRLTYDDDKAGCDCVELNDATLAVTANFTATPGMTFTILSRSGGSGLISGTFKDLPQGAVFKTNGQQFLVNYLPFTGPTAVRLTRLAVPHLGIVPLSGSGQSAEIETEFAQPLRARVSDENGNPAADVLVTFSGPSSGPGATFPLSNTALTDASGVVTAPIKANAVPGSYVISANIGPTAITPATFSLTNTATFSLAVNTAGDGSGLVSLDPPGGSYDYGAMVTLTAAPAADSIFAGWSGDRVSAANPLTVTMTDTVILTATFNRDSTPPDVSGVTLLAPRGTITNPRPLFDWTDASDPSGVVSYTWQLNDDAGDPFLVTATATSHFTPTTDLPPGDYTWSARAHDANANASPFVSPPAAFSLSETKTTYQVYLPISQK